MLLQPLFYALRPVFTKPLTPIALEVVNFAVVLLFDYAMWVNFTGWSVAYLVVSTLLGMGVHPVAGHFIAEHYQFIQGQEVWSPMFVCSVFVSDSYCRRTLITVH